MRTREHPVNIDFFIGGVSNSCTYYNYHQNRTISRIIPKYSVSLTLNNKRIYTCIKSFIDCVHYIKWIIMFVISYIFKILMKQTEGRVYRKRFRIYTSIKILLMLPFFYMLVIYKLRNLWYQINCQLCTLYRMSQNYRTTC